MAESLPTLGTVIPKASSCLSVQGFQSSDRPERRQVTQPVKMLEMHVSMLAHMNALLTQSFYERAKLMSMHFPRLKHLLVSHGTSFSTPGASERIMQSYLGVPPGIHGIVMVTCLHSPYFREDSVCPYIMTFRELEGAMRITYHYESLGTHSCDFCMCPRKVWALFLLPWNLSTMEPTPICSVRL